MNLFVSIIGKLEGGFRPTFASGRILKSAPSEADINEGRVLSQRHGILTSEIISITVCGGDEGRGDGGVDAQVLASSIRRLG